MSRIAIRNQPCLSPECGSSDARQVYEEGDSYCFSCTTKFPADAGEYPKAVERRNMSEEIEHKLTVTGIANYPSRRFAERKISKEVNEFFGVKASVDQDGKAEAHYYPYDNGAVYKVRRLPKQFSWTKHSNSLFGMEHFNGGGKRVIICEGEIDTLSVAQASFDRYKGKIYPVVGLSSSAMTKSLLEHREWLRSFDEIILCFDQDTAGEKALKEALKIVGVDKAKIVKLPCNDANETLQKHDSNTLMQALFDAASYIPSGMISKEDVWKQILASQNQVSIPYPDCVRGLNKKLKGMRGGEIALFISGTGSGKSTMMKENTLHLVAFQDKLIDLINEKNLRLEEGQEPLEPFQIKVGIVSLEEPPAQTGKTLASMHLKRNLSKEEIPLSILREGFDAVYDDKHLMLLDHQGSMNDSSIIEKLEHMILSGCTHLIIDHITILVSEGAEGLSGNEAQDKVMNDLLRLVTRYPHVWIGLVSHLRKAQSGKPFEEGHMPTIDDIKGSGSIKQISFDIIAFCRNMVAEEEAERNIIQMSVLKCRHTGLTGPVPGAQYDYDTGRLFYLEDTDYFELLASKKEDDSFQKVESEPLKQKRFKMELPGSKVEGAL